MGTGQDEGESTAGGERDVWADGAWRAFSVVRREALAAGETIPEQTIIDQEDTTVVIPSGWQGHVGTTDALTLTRAV